MNTWVVCLLQYTPIRSLCSSNAMLVTSISAIIFYFLYNPNLSPRRNNTPNQLLFKLSSRVISSTLANTKNISILSAFKLLQIAKFKIYNTVWPLTRLVHTWFSQPLNWEKYKFSHSRNPHGSEEYYIYDDVKRNLHCNQFSHLSAEDHLLNSLRVPVGA